MTVEFLRALDDGSWDVVTATVPDETADLVAWANKNLLPQAQHRRAVLFAVYSILTPKKV